MDRIGVDLERIGKAQRQHGLATWISAHRHDDLARLELRRARRFARVEPADPRIDELIELGAEVLMLPMVASAREAAAFADAVAGRAVVVLLVERREAVEAIGELVRVDGVDEIHLGLNDLALSLGMRNRWQVLGADLGLRVGATVREAGLPYGLGGIGRAGDRSLPLPSDLVCAEVARCGATGALLSRSFTNGPLAADVARARSRLAFWRAAGAPALGAAHAELAARARRLTSF